jgi:hypothetical protein
MKNFKLLVLAVLLSSGGVKPSNADVFLSNEIKDLLKKDFNIMRQNCWQPLSPEASAAICEYDSRWARGDTGPWFSLDNIFDSTISFYSDIYDDISRSCCDFCDVIQMVEFLKLTQLKGFELKNFCQAVNEVKQFLCYQSDPFKESETLSFLKNFNAIDGKVTTFDEMAWDSPRCKIFVKLCFEKKIFIREFFNSSTRKNNSHNKFVSFCGKLLDELDEIEKENLERFKTLALALSRKKPNEFCGDLGSITFQYLN